MAPKRRGFEDENSHFTSNGNDHSSSLSTVPAVLSVPSSSSSITTSKRRRQDPTAAIDAVAAAGRVVLSRRDKAAEIALSEDQLTCIGQAGYRMIRATHGVHNGLYYWEAEILSPLVTNEDTHVRLGWSTRQAPLQAPVGYDKKSFGYRDICGRFRRFQFAFDFCVQLPFFYEYHRVQGS